MKKPMTKPAGGFNPLNQNKVEIPPSVGLKNFGDLHRLSPISRVWGFDRGIKGLGNRAQNIDRYYIEAFLQRHSTDIKGRVLEIGDSLYTHEFGGDRVTSAEILDADPNNIAATHIYDLAVGGNNFPEGKFDCFILTQTLLLIYDVKSAIENVFLALKPGGVLLVTLPGISQICTDEMEQWGDFWRFTSASAKRLFGEIFGYENITVETHGNVLAACGFLFNLGACELRKEELDFNDPNYQVIITIRAVKKVDTISNPTNKSGIRNVQDEKIDVEFSENKPGNDLQLTQPDHGARIVKKILMYIYDRKRQLGKYVSLHKNIEFLNSSELFDKNWYLANNPDVAKSSMSAAKHYLLYGGFEGRNPGPNFSSEWYLHTNPDVNNARINPLVHYLKCGRKEGRLPHFRSNENALRATSFFGLNNSTLFNNLKVSLLNKRNTDQIDTGLVNSPEGGGTGKTLNFRSNCGAIWASPNPVIAKDFLARGRTILSWNCDGVKNIEIRVGQPDGALLVRADPTGEQPVDITGESMRFFLQDVTNNRKLVRENTLAICDVQLIRGRFLEQGLPFLDGTARYKAPHSKLKALVAGYFSFDYGGATAGDLITKDIVCDWLLSSKVSYDVALNIPFRGGVDWQTVDPTEYDILLFCCGPFFRQELTHQLLVRFAHAQIIGINLSMQMPLADYNPFDILFERDSERLSRPDLVFLSDRPRIPVVGLIPVEPIAEFGFSGAHDKVNDIIRNFLRKRDISVVEIDTRLDTNFSGQRSSAAIESLIAKMDTVITTRLHGMVFAIKNGVPPIVIDPHVEAAKVFRQAVTIGWPIRFTASELSMEKLGKAFDYCLTNEAKAVALKCFKRQKENLGNISSDFYAAVLRGKNIHNKT